MKQKSAWRMALAFLAALALAFLFVWPEDLGLDEDGFTLPEMEQQSSVSASKLDSEVLTRALGVRNASHRRSDTPKVPSTALVSSITCVHYYYYPSVYPCL